MIPPIFLSHKSSGPIDLPCKGKDSKCIIGAYERNYRMRALHIFITACLVCACSIGICQESTIRNSIQVPGGFQRELYPDGGYSHWIQNLALKSKPVIINYKGQVVESGLYRVLGVVQMPLLFQSDLEQCADFAMRFWAEYHKSEGKLNKLYLFDYSGHKMLFATSGKSYTNFLKSAFANSNSHSLKSGCKSVSESDIVPGDMLVQNERGGIGHVSVVMDACKNKEGKRLFLIGYSFMPAQEFHIEKASDSYGSEGWFTLEGYTQYLRDNLNYGKPELRRFDSL
jgi:hypothetical protein